MYAMVSAATFALLFSRVDSYSTSRFIGLTFSCVAIAFSIWQLREQFARWRQPELYLNDDNELFAKIFKGQARRRFQIALLIGVFGILIYIGLHVSPVGRPLLCAITWLCVLLLGLWICLLAGADALAVWMLYREAQRRNELEQIAQTYLTSRGRHKHEEDSSEQSDSNASTTAEQVVSQLARQTASEHSATSQNHDAN
ncbi:MAG: hypothetical protein Q4G03_02320 [Planctomycetia bacterium]|nr:hypothetical protein [Planctomycetia bacterium]